MVLMPVFLLRDDEQAAGPAARDDAQRRTLGRRHNALVKGLWMMSMALLTSAVMASPGLGMNLSWTLRPSSLK